MGGTEAKKIHQRWRWRCQKTAEMRGYLDWINKNPGPDSEEGGLWGIGN